LAEALDYAYLTALAMALPTARFRADLRPSKGAEEVVLALNLESVVLRGAGIEFESDRFLQVLTEWQLTLTMPDNSRFLARTVVVACDESKPGRWRLSMYFLHLEELEPEMQWLTA
jgi:hypothetical protein